MTTEAMRAAFGAWYATESQRERDTDNLLNRRDWKVWQAATLAERERAAKVCEEQFQNMATWQSHTGLTCAAAIRQGETP